MQLYLHSPDCLYGEYRDNFTFFLQGGCRGVDVVLSILAGITCLNLLTDLFTLSDADELCLFVSMAGPVTWVVAFCVISIDQSPILEITVPVYHTVLIRENPLSASY